MSVFEFSDRTKKYQAELLDFMDKHVYPAEAVYEEQMRESGNPHFQPPIIDDLKKEAKARGLWNLFHPHPEWGPGLTNLEYAPLAEIMGRSHLASEATNCAAPDTGNMEVLTLFGTDEHKEKYLKPLLEGEIRSAFAMTEPEVASSDATNIQLRMDRDGDEYVLNGRKWFASNALHQNCKVLIVMGKTDFNAATHRQQSMMVVPIDAPGVTILRNLPVFGYQDREGHGEITFEDVRVPAKDILAGEGEGFAISQARLGPGRIHHCMRAIGMAERALELMCKRASTRITFGKPVSDNANIQDWIAEARIDIEMVRLLTLKARTHDGHGGQQGSAHRDRSHQGCGTEHRAQDHRPRPSRFTAVAASPTTSRSRWLTPTCAPFAWRTARTRCTSAPSPSRNCASTAKSRRTDMAGLDLTGKTAIVTGASRGIGLATAQAIAAAGGNVVLTSRSQESADAAAAQVNGNAIGIGAHATDEDAARKCVEQTIERFGSLDILVNNAGTNPSFGPIINQDHSRFAKTFDVNVWAPVLWTGLAARAWMGEHGGSVVNTASIGGMAFEAGIGTYNASKAALIHITKQLALELSPKIRVNAVAPGVVRTKLAEALWKEHEDAVSASTALGRIGEPEDVAAAIAFLVSDAAQWITGEIMTIDGGQLLGDALPFRQGASVGG